MPPRVECSGKRTPNYWALDEWNTDTYRRAFKHRSQTGPIPKCWINVYFAYNRSMYIAMVEVVTARRTNGLISQTSPTPPPSASPTRLDPHNNTTLSHLANRILARSQIGLNISFFITNMARACFRFSRPCHWISRTFLPSEILTLSISPSMIFSKPSQLSTQEFMQIKHMPHIKDMTYTPCLYFPPTTSPTTIK